MIEKIYFAQGLTSPTALEYCTALRDAFVNDSDLSVWFDVSEVDTTKFTVTLKGTSVSFDILYSTTWFYTSNFKNFTGSAVSMNGGIFYHNLNTELPLYKTVTENSIAIHFLTDTDDDFTMLTGFSKMKNIDDDTNNILCFNLNGTHVYYYSENISKIDMNSAVDKRGNYDNFICVPWFPQNSGYMGKDLFRYDGGHALLTKGFYDIDGNRFLALSKMCNILLKCD